MILTKNKTLFKKNIKNTFKKRSLIKKSLIGSSILFCALLSWEASVTLTNSINISNRIDSSITYFSNLGNYENFKSKINGIPYTDKEFERDLKLFGYIFENNDTPLMKMKYGNYEMRNFMIDRVVLKNENIDKIFAPIIFKANKFRNDKIDYKTYDEMRYYNFHDYNINEDKISDYKSASVRINGMLGKQLIIDDKIYENIRQLIKEKGFSEDLLYLGKDKQIKYTEALSKVMSSEESYKNKHDYEEALNKADYKFTREKKESLDKIKEYYKNGDYQKIKDLFRVLNGFSYIVVDEIKDKNKFEEYGVRPSLLVEAGLQKIGVINEDNDLFQRYYMNDAKRVAKIKGTYNKESKEYYDGKEWVLLNY